MDKLKEIATKILWAFALISIGFALGRNSGGSVNKQAQADTSNTKPESSLRLVVYYTHATARCSTCRSIEKNTHAVLEKDFKKELETGIIQWKVVNFQTDATFAEKFDVAASGVILAIMNDEKVEKVEKLEEVWTLIDKPAEFQRYIEESVKKALKGGK